MANDDLLTSAFADCVSKRGASIAAHTAEAHESTSSFRERNLTRSGITTASRDTVSEAMTESPAA
jgi:hypothetical protein